MSDAPPPHALLRPRIALPFLAISLIWGSTWFVIIGQIAERPVEWTVAWRFMIATPAMFVLAVASKSPLVLPRRAWPVVAIVGLCQFAGNYNLVYHAEHHLTSGIVAVMVGLMIVSNAVLGWFVLRQPITPRFALGSAIAIAGIGLLLAHETRGSAIGGNVVAGVLFALAGMFGASISNVIQAGDRAKGVPLPTFIAWSMLVGLMIDLALALALHGPVAMPTGAAFWAGTAYLALAGSVVTFPLYFRLIRDIGAGRAAYHNVLVVIVAMVLSTLFEGYSWSLLAVGGAVLALIGLIIALRAKSV